MTDLDPRVADALERATSDLPVRDRVTPAVHRAGAVRRRRRAASGAAVALVVAAAVVVPSLVDRGAQPQPAPSPTVVTPAPSPTSAPGDWPTWDPATLPDTPYGESVLPEVIDPPQVAPSVLEDPVEAAVLAWPAKGRDLLLLGTDRTWRSVPGTADALEGTLRDTVEAVLTSDGTKLALATNDGVRVVDVTDGSDDLLPWPAALAGPWDTAPALVWLPGDTEIAAMGWRATRVLGLDGSNREPSWRRAQPVTVFVDPDEGTVWQSSWRDKTVLRWDGDLIPHKFLHSWSWGQGFAAGHGRIGLMGSLPATVDGQTLTVGPVVVDPADGEPVAYAAVEDPHGAYGDNAHLVVRGFLDADTALLVVRPDDFGKDRDPVPTYVVAWDFVTGEFRVLSRTDASGVFDADPLRSGSIAVGALR